jgi:hypothetical protein
MATDTIPAPASSINAPTPIKGEEVGPPVAGNADAEVTAEALPLAVAVAVAIGVPTPGGG